MSVARRHFRSLGFWGSTCALLLLIVVGPQVVWVQAQQSPAARPPIKIGFLNTRTGPFSADGEMVDLGFRLGLEELGSESAGRKIEVITEDDRADPSTGLTKARKLLDGDRVHILFGPISSAVALALRDYVVEKGAPWVIHQATAGTLTRERRAPNLFRLSYTEEQIHAPMGPYFYNKLGYKKLAVVALDFVTGHVMMAAFEKSFTEAGGQVIQKIFMPLGAPDPGPYITRINTKDADAVHLILFGADALRFVKQAKEFGLFEKARITMFGPALEEGLLLPAYGDEVIGIVNYMDYAAGWDNPATKSFVRAYQAKSGGRLPTQQSALAYEGAHAMVMALKAVQGNVENTPAFFAALRKVEFEGPKGPFKLDACQNKIMTMFVRKVEKVGAQLQHTVIDVLRGIADSGCPVR